MERQNTGKQIKRIFLVSVFAKGRILYNTYHVKGTLVHQQGLRLLQDLIGYTVEDKS